MSIIEIRSHGRSKLSGASKRRVMADGITPLMVSNYLYIMIWLFMFTKSISMVASF